MKIQHVLMLLVTWIIVSFSQHYDDERLLVAYLFSEDRYNKDVRPSLNRTLPIYVNISFRINLLSEMAVTEESICLFGYVSMSWIDEKLTWNPDDHGGIHEITPPFELLWKPKIAFSRYSAACKDKGSEVLEMVTLAYDGMVSYLFTGFMAAPCIVDVKLFPFDHHECIVRLYDHTKRMNELVLQTQDHLVHHEVIYSHAEWKVNNILSTMENRQLTDRFGIAIYKCQFKVSRRPEYVVIHNIIPAGFVILLSVFVPFIPPDTGERLSYAITTYLATVFMTVLFYDNVPRSSVCITLMSYNLIIYYAISSVGLIWSIAIVCLSRQKTEQMKIPKFIVTRLRKIKIDLNNDVETFDNNREETVERTEHAADINGQVCLQNSDHNAKQTMIGWYEATRYLDKMFFIFTLICYTFLIGYNILVITTDGLNTCLSLYKK